MLSRKKRHYLTPNERNISMLNMGIGENIRRLREAKGWTQERLANEIGVTQGLISQYERYETRQQPDIIDKIAKALDANANRLYNEPHELDPLNTLSPDDQDLFDGFKDFADLSEADKEDIRDILRLAKKKIDKAKKERINQDQDSKTPVPHRPGAK